MIRMTTNELGTAIVSILTPNQYAEIESNRSFILSPTIALLTSGAGCIAHQLTLG